MSDSDNVFNANFRSRLVAHKREDFATHAETVEQETSIEECIRYIESRAQLLADKDKRPLDEYHSLHGIVQTASLLRDLIRSESALAAVAELEALTMVETVFHDESRRYCIPLQLIHDAILRLRLRAEAVDVAKEGR